MHYYPELLFSITLANSPRRVTISAWAISGSATRKVVQQLYMAVLPHPLLTLDFSSLRVKVITVFEVQNCFFLRLESKDLDFFAFFCSSGLLVACWHHGGATHASPSLPLMRHQTTTGSVYSVPRLLAKTLYLERTEIFCPAKSPDSVLGWNLMVCDCQAR